MGKMGSKNANDVLPQDRNDVLEHLKKLAYAPTRKSYSSGQNKVPITYRLVAD